MKTPFCREREAAASARAAMLDPWNMAAHADDPCFMKMIHLIQLQNPSNLSEMTNNTHLQVHLNKLECRDTRKN